MAEGQQIYGKVDNKTDLQDVFKQIREDVRDADDRSALTELYRRAGYLITLSQAPSWEEKFGDDADEMRDLAEEEFAKTARTVNRRADDIGTDADYDEEWGD